MALAVYLAVLMAAALAVPYLARTGGAWTGARWPPSSASGSRAPACAEALTVMRHVGTLAALHLLLAGLWAAAAGAPRRTTRSAAAASIPGHHLRMALWKHAGLAPETFALPVIALAART